VHTKSASATVIDAFPCSDCNGSTSESSSNEAVFMFLIVVTASAAVQWSQAQEGISGKRGVVVVGDVMQYLVVASGRVSPTLSSFCDADGNNGLAWLDGSRAKEIDRLEWLRV